MEKDNSKLFCEFDALDVINIYRPIQTITYETDWCGLHLIKPVKCELCNKETVFVNKNQKTEEIKNICFFCFDIEKYATSSRSL